VPNYITGNLVTEQIRGNEDRALQEMQVRNAIAQDRLRRQIAEIYGEGAPTAQPAPVQPETNYSIAPEAQPRQALSGFNAPPQSAQIPAQPAPSPAQPSPIARDTRFQRALRLAASQPGAGEMAMEIADKQLAGESASAKSREAKLNKVHDMLADGNIGGAQFFAQQYGLRELEQLFSNPRALAAVASSSAAAKRLGLTGREGAAYTESFLQNLKNGASPSDAYEAAYRAVLDMPEDITRIVTSDSGEVYGVTKRGEGRPITGVKGKSRAARSGGGATSTTVQRTFAAADGAMWAVMKDGSTKQLVDAQGTPIRSNEQNKLAGQIYLKSADMPGASVEAARNVAGQLYPSPNAPVVQPPQVPGTSQSGKIIRRFVPGQGFTNR